MKILTISLADFAGGAEKVAYDLFKKYRDQGCQSHMAVGIKITHDPDIIQLKQRLQDYSPWKRIWLKLGKRLSQYADQGATSTRVRELIEQIGDVKRLIAEALGHEFFDFAVTQRLLDLTPERPEIIHCHNLHHGGMESGGYFDLRKLSSLSRQVPIVLTLHDAWMLSGHCAHSFECERWTIGCGCCPDLNLYPAIKRDGTAYNWRRKRQIYASSRLYIATPCRWLMQKVQRSILAPAAIETRVIPYGIDLSIFKPAEKIVARSSLGLSQSAHILLFAANGIRHNMWKDYEMMRGAIAKIAQATNDEIIFVALGENAPNEYIGTAEIRFIAHQKDPQLVAQYYQAADLYLHAARVDTFPNAVLEALACGTPVIATAVGGIPEQVNNLQDSGDMQSSGILVPSGDVAAMAEAVLHVLHNTQLCQQMSQFAASDARIRFDLNRQVEDYLGWYEEILSTTTQVSSDHLP